MILTLNTYDYYFFDSEPFKYYSVEDNGNPDIEEIHYLGEDLDLANPESYDLAIDFLKKCKECDRELCDTCKSPMTDTLFGTIFVSSLEKIHDTINEEIDKLIELLKCTKNKLLLSKGIEFERGCEGCCTYKDDEYCDKCCDACKEPESADDTDDVEESNTSTFHWAQKYMDTVIDPESELCEAEYDILLALFTQYGDWILKQ